MLQAAARALVPVALASTAAACGAPQPSATAAPLPAAAIAAPPSVPDAGPQPEPARFTVTRAMIPMRDGVKLETIVFAPKQSAAPLPFLFTRSPYGVPEDERWATRRPPAALLADGYIWVFQNLRGRFGSEGVFVMDRPPRDRRDPSSVDEASDAYDTIEWLLRKVPDNNGRVGMTGASYSALTAVLAAVEPHPALRAVVEEASPADQFLGDDFHHNGAFRLAYGFEYVALLESSKEKNSLFSFANRDIYDFYLDLGPLVNADRRHFHGAMPAWNDFVAHPSYDAYWQKAAFASFLKEAKVPILHCAGFWDQEDFYGPLKAYELLEKSDAKGLNQIVIGPWNHGGWFGSGRKLGGIDFGSETGDHYRDRIKAPFLASLLHEKGPVVRAEATIFQTGKNQWRTFDRWPPREGVTEKKLYAREGRALSFDPPRDVGDASDAYISDPDDPVPFYPRPIDPLFSGDQWPAWEVADQRFVDHRPDVLGYASPPLERDVTVVGEVQVQLFAATSGTDSDWVVKLIDVFPDGPPAKPPELTHAKDPAQGAPDLRGFQLMIGGEVFRGRFRGSFAEPAPLPANRVLAYTIGLHATAHTFQRGHRIMLQIQSTWFPLIDRNPQRYVANIFKAEAADFVKTTQRVSRSRRAPTAIVLPIMEGP